ncbi:MAG: efflux RND transporter permease subunit [Thermodesulfobacteriota bacterium]|nr:efflux RND transporter permease subunit [Thermodesulfobacteriota bacterium]
MKLPEFAVKQPVAALMLFLALALLGGFSLAKLNVDMLPDIDPPVVSILTTWPGASASDVEAEVTEPIEDMVNSVNNLDTLTSKSLDNLSVIACKFDWGSDLDVATNDIRDKLEIVRRSLPDDAEAPMLFKFSSGTAPIMFMTISAEKSWPRLYHLVDKQVADELKRVPGVGAIIVHGGLRRRINVYFDLEKVEGFNLSLPMINRILAQENMNVPAGSIKSGSKDYFVRIPARYRSMGEIRNTVIGVHRGRPVYLKDVARVEDGYEPQDLNGWGDGKPALVMILQKQTGKNTVEVVESVKKRLEQLKKNLPPDVKVDIITDTSENILDSLENLTGTLSWGILLVVAVTLLFLRRIRTALIISLTIPFSLITSFILLNIFGYTINLISLMALAIAAGLVVDNGIVVLENIIGHIERGGRISTSAIFGASEMGMAITTSTLTTVVIFVPLMFLSGISGIIFKQLGFVMVVTIMASLLTALMLTPMLSSKLIVATPESLKKRAGMLGRLYRFSEKGFEAVEDAYRRVLEWSLEHRKTVILLAVAIFASSVSLVPFLSTSFFPNVDTGEVNINFRLAEGTRIEETNVVVEEIMKNIFEVVKREELEHFYGFDGETKEGIGAALGFDQGPNVGSIGMKLVDRDQRARTVEEVAAALRERVQTIPGLSKIQVRAESGMASVLMGAGKAISLELQGSDLDEVLALAQRLKKVMNKIPGLVDVTISQKDPRPELWVEVDRKKASALGLNIAVIAGTLRNYFYGMEATQFRDAGDKFEIFTRFTEKDKDRLMNLPNVPLITPDGRMVRLKNVARIVDGWGPIEVERKNRQKIVKVEGDLYERSLGEVTADLEAALAGEDIPTGLSVNFSGDVEEQKTAFRDLTMLLLLGIVLVYMVMASLFGNLRDPFIIMFSVPFAFSGVLYAFYLTGTSLGIMSFMGVVMLMGIVVNNAIVLLDYTHLLQKRGQPLFEAVTQAGRSRLRPVLMTTMTTFFGMLPMAVSDKVGAEAWNPLGITMLGGLSVSTLVTLVLVPTIFFMFERRKQARQKRITL